MKTLLIALSVLTFAVACNNQENFQQKQQEVKRDYQEDVNEAKQERREEMQDINEEMNEAQREEAVDYSDDVDATHRQNEPFDAQESSEQN